MSRLARIALVATACVLAPVALSAQPRVFVRDAGPGRMARIVGQVLARPYTLITPVAGDTSDVIIGRDTTLTQSLVVMGRTVRIAAAVQGDVLVLDGDLFLRPGARIAGDVIATGGAVFNSTLAFVGGEFHSFRDETYVATRLTDGSYALDYRALRRAPYSLVSWPGIYGVRIPQYDRVNGLALPVAPLIALDSGRITVEPTLTYRSHLGKIDPSAVGTISMGRRTRAEVFVGRTSETNDDWINGNLGNAMSSFFAGRDTRNWYRADRAEGTLHRLYETPTAEITPYVGAQWDQAWSTGIQDYPPRHVAYSVLDRRDSVEGMMRFNPPVDEGDILSGVAGFDGTWEPASSRLEVRGTGRLEIAPEAVTGQFSQLTLDGRVKFPLVRDLEFRFDWHVVASQGGAPRQRYAYLGGSGTLPTRDLLSMGGDQLVFFESRVTKPFESIKLPLVGSPTLALRHMMGSAGAGRLPGLTHNLAVRVSVMLLRAEFVIDPVAGDTDFGVAVSFTR